MQLVPAAARFGVRDTWDPEQNLKGGMAYLRWLLDHFDGDIGLALAGYNAGEKAVEHHGGIPAYAETHAYVERIIKRIGGRGLTLQKQVLRFITKISWHRRRSFISREQGRGE